MANRDDNKAEKNISLNQRQISYIAAAFLLGSFFVFMAGYYWGKRYALEPITEQLVSDALADKIYCSLCADEAFKEEHKGEQTLAQSEEPKKVSDIEPKSVRLQEGGYYAQVARFSSKEDANTRTKKLASFGLHVQVREEPSRSTNNIEKKLYLVCTDFYPSRQELMDTLRPLARRARRYIKLQNVSVIYADKDQKERLSLKGKVA